MLEYVRVKDKETGHHLSITRGAFDRDPSLWEELKSDATYADGSPRPVKFKTTVSREAAKSTTPSGQSAGTEKE